jgi:glycosyltransferase involved in cell wall biosynthesis
MDAEPPPVALSIVVPFFNEEEVAHGVVDELGAALTALGRPWEAILVDDGSADGTLGELERAKKQWPQCRILHFSENRGQGAALYDGIRAARAPQIAMMDGDGQNVPADIGVLAALLDRADLVVGVRSNRHDSRLRRVLSRLANRVRSRMLKDGMSDAGCALKVFRREIIGALWPIPMLNPFMPALAAAAGFRVIEHPVQHRHRAGGRSKYGLRVMLWRPCLDLLAVWWLLRRRKASRKGP